MEFLEFLPLEQLTTDTLLLNLSRTGGKFEVVVGESVCQQNICEFMLTFSFMQGKDMEEYMSNLADAYDQVRVPLSGCGRSVTLDLSDFARLRSLYSQRMFDLKLEDMLMRHGICTHDAATRQSAWM